MIVAENLKKSYHQTLALNDVSFSIESGEIVGLLGLNGAGKSTILKILGCLLLPSHGAAYVDGFSVEENPEKVRERIGYLPDTPPLYDEMLVESYLRFVAKLKKVPPSQIEQRIGFVLEKTNTADVKNERLGTLSHGYRQRIGIAQALVNDPKVLILDEPISGLDPIQIVEVRDLINSLRGEHTVILSSHILSEITKTCDRILMIDKGRLVVQGSEKQIEEDLTKTGLIKCRVKNMAEGLIPKLETLDGVESVSNRDTGDSEYQIDVSVNKDIRPVIAKTIVESGSDLLAFDRDAAGLEKLFLKLVK